MLEQSLENKDDYLKTKQEVEASNAQNNLFELEAMGVNLIKFISGSVIIKREVNKSWSSQLMNINSQLKYLNLRLDTTIGKNQDIVNDFFNDNTNEKTWYPINSTVIANGVFFQNQSFLDEDGGYIETINYLNPFVFNNWKNLHQDVV